MSMYTICQEILADGKLDESLASLAESERTFTSEIGVLDRYFYQCRQQPHVLWARTEWTSEKHHNEAAKGLMKVREDDRVASAYFRPGLYFEIFALPVPAACLGDDGAPGELVVVAHGIVAKRFLDGWEERVARRLAELGTPRGLERLRTYRNYAAQGEFVAFFEWSDEDAYAAAREGEARTVEERVLVEEGRSDLAAYIQFECRPLVVEPAGV